MNGSTLQDVQYVFTTVKRSEVELSVELKLKLINIPL